ncbi:MAG: UbiA family prenyltransferase [Chitinophagales bacterium]
MPLSINTFFSTWLVYQFSRYSFHKNYDVGPDAQKDEIYQFVDKHQSFTKISIVLALIGTIISCFYLRIETLLFIGGLGLVSLLYPLKFGSYSLRSVPFLKIFIIAFVWSSTAVWVPFIEIRYDAYWYEYLLHFSFFFLFILFITLPFDINDIDVDHKTGVKTIPALLGIDKTNKLIRLLGVILAILSVLIFQDTLFLIFIILLIMVLGMYAIKYAQQIEKWKVMAIYDGAMILLYLVIMGYVELTLFIL